MQPRAYANVYSNYTGLALYTYTILRRVRRMGRQWNQGSKVRWVTAWDYVLDITALGREETGLMRNHSGVL